MNAILRRSTEMITPEAWAELDAQAKRVLSLSLAGRKFVDIVGPKGWDYAGHPLGRLDIKTSSPVNGVEFGVNRVLPLVEARSVFELDQWELDNISRGSKNPDIKQDFKVTEQVLADFFKFVDSRPVPFEKKAAELYAAEKDPAVIQRAIREELTTAVFGREAGYKVTLEGDKQLKTAVTLFPQAEKLAGLDTPEKRPATEAVARK